MLTSSFNNLRYCDVHDRSPYLCSSFGKFLLYTRIQYHNNNYIFLCLVLHNLSFKFFAVIIYNYLNFIETIKADKMNQIID